MSEAVEVAQLAPKRRPRKRLRFALIIGLVLMALLIYGGFRVLNSTANGTIVSPKAAQTSVTEAVNYTTQTNQYASFQYPTTFIPVKANPAIAPTLIDYGFTRQSGGSASLNIGIYSLPGGNLANDSTYHYRQEFPNQYSFTSLEINGQAIPMASDVTKGSYNEVAYLQHGSYDATVSLENIDNLDGSNSQMTAVMKALLRSWQWH